MPENSYLNLVYKNAGINKIFGKYTFNINDMKKVKDIVITENSTILSTYLHLPSKELVAENERKIKEVLKELEIMQTISVNQKMQAHIVAYYGSGLHKEKQGPYFLYLFMEPMDFSAAELNRCLKLITISSEVYLSRLIKSIHDSVQKGFQVLIEEKIVHCDIKPSNILINNRGQVKICDFGESIYNNENLNPNGSILYWHPKMFKTHENIEPHYRDFWALGISLIELILFENPLESICKRRNISFTMSGLANVMETLTPDILINPLYGLVSKELINDIEKCLNPESIGYYTNAKWNKEYLEDNKIILNIKEMLDKGISSPLNKLHFSDATYDYNINDLQPANTNKYSDLLTPTKYHFIHTPSNKLVTRIEWRLLTIAKSPKFKYIFEKKVMQELNHPHIVELYAYITELGTRLIFLEPFFLSLHDLNNIICNESNELLFPEEIFGYITVNVLETLKELSHANIIHGHMCPRDIIVLWDGTVKLMGFQHLNIKDAPVDRDTNAYWLVSLIDINLGRLYDPKFDIWFFGITLVQIATREIFYSKIEKPILMDIMKNGPKTTATRDEEVRALLREEFSEKFDNLRLEIFEYISKRYSSIFTEFILNCIEDYEKRYDYDALMCSTFVEKHLETYEIDQKFLLDKIRNFEI